MAREEANSPAGEVITGLPRQVLDRLSKLSLDQIEEIAQEVGVSLITIRLSENQLDRLIALKSPRRAAYALAVMAPDGR